MFNLTNSQKSIWVTEQYYKGSSVNNICGSAIIEEQIDFEKLEKAVQIVYKKHDNFRLQLKIEDGEVKQILTNKEETEIEILDIADPKELEKETKKIVRTPFELKNSELFKFYIIKFKNGEGGFMLNIHHLMADAWTLAFISNEIIKTYSELKQEKEVEAEAIYSYIDYIKAEQEYLESEKYKKDKAYWEEKFAQIPEVATIPGSKENADESNPQGERKQFNLSASQVEEIKQYCKGNKISLYNFFMAVYAIYLGEISNLDEFVIGTPILNRTNFKEKNAAGMFINMAPFKIKMDQSSDFKTFIKNIAIDSMGMLKHQKYSYQSLLENLREKNKTIPSLYNILLSYQITNAHQTGEGMTYKTQWTFNGCCAENMDIQIYDLNDTGSLNIAYDYKTSIYSVEDIEKLHKRILNIIKQVVSKENIDLKDIEIVTPEEKKQLVIDFNKTELEYDENVPIIKFFEEQASKTPENIAMVFENKKMTYKELNEKANSLAHELRENGVTNNTIVGIMQDRSFEMIIAILAVLKSGGSYIPIAPDYPNERIEYMLEDSKATILLTTNGNRIKTDKKVIDINLNGPLYKKNKENIKNISKPEDLSYLIYTSGSTGTPKGVMLKQKNLTNFYHAMKDTIEYLKDGKQHKIISITTVSFDIFIFETIMSLTKGLTLYMTNENEQKITSQLENLIKQNEIEILQTTPSVMKFHLDNLENKEDIKSLKYIMLAGEPLHKTLVDKLKEVIPGVTVYNGYGPSETTIFSSTRDVTNLERVTIGRPIANTQIYILNKNKKLMPQGTIGEIYIAGDGVGKGYMNKKQQTESSFIPNLFAPNGIMYKVGDLGSFDEFGEITCYGRVDNQIKIRGLRVELPEIEKQMLSAHNVKNTVVVKKEINGREVLCAYYIPNGPVDENTMKTILQDKLPQYMIPQYFVKLKEMPYTPNGKIDKRALPIPNTKEKLKEKIEIRNEIDKELLQIIQKMMNIENISLSDTLIDIGGDSLTAITLITKISSKFDVQLYIKDIMSNKTIKDISDLIRYEQEKGSSKIKIEKVPEQDVYPLSSAQKRMYYNSKMIEENNTVYNVPGAILVDDILDKEKVENAFKKIITRHSALRTVFVLQENTVMQKINNQVDFEIPIYHNTEREVQKIIDNFSKSFDLEKDLLLRVELHYIDNQKTLLLVESHHAVMDGTSLNNLIIEFEKLYNGEDLKTIPVEYKDYAVWENKFNESEAIKKVENYWVNKFKEAEFSQLNLPYDYKMSASRSYKGSKISNVIDEEQFRKIEKYAEKIGVSPYMLFISAFLILLYKYTGQEEITLGSPIANRDISETERMIGMFVNNIVVKGNINSEETFRDFLNEMKEQILDDLSNQPYPFDMLVKKLGIKADNSRNPLFDVMFTYQNQEENMLNLNNHEAEVIEIDNNVAKFNLSLEIKPKTHTVNIEYCTDLFKKQTVERLFEHYMNVIDSIVADNNVKIKDISIISEQEKNKILYEFNDTKTDYPKNKTVTQLFEEQAEKTPDNVAVKCGVEGITYDELQKKSNYLANKWIDMGIEKGDVVGINLNRSLELIVSMLAVLKVGAIYMPMYVGYPKERLEYMLQNSNAKMLIHNGEDDLTFNGIKEKISSYKMIKEENEIKKNVLFDSEEVAYIIYTSGSTGKPKGVQIKHRNLINFVNAFKEYYNDDITSKDNFLASTNISFDVSIWEIFLPILNGATLVLYEEEIIQDIITYTKTIENEQITGLYIPPNILDEVYNTLKNKDNIKINKMLVGVEPIRKNVLNKYYNLNPDLIIVNGYGPTEITICCTAFEYQKDEQDGIVSIGRPLKNNKIYILSSDKNLQPIGIPGEIYVTGAGVGEGYINKKAETNKNFLKNIWDNESERMYKTGDIAKWNEDGTINFIGRNDSQVKISGHRIELNEINHTIMEYPSIIKSYTTIYKKAEKNYIVSYYIAEKEIANTDLLTFLKEKLADYMAPNFMIQLQEFPLTPNGKVDKEKLPTNFGTRVEYIEPRDEFERQIAEIFKKLFLLKKVGIDDNFFELGGDSLIAIKFQIEALNLGLKITYSDIFSNPTIRMLSERKNKKIIYKVDKNYDFNKINDIIAKNNISELTETKNKKKINNVLLIGATGFLGAHILEQLILSDANKIYCIVRAKSSIEPENRLKKNMEFYFGDKYNHLLGNKIIVIDGDITDKKLGQKDEEFQLLQQDVDVVIHTAAIVKHYGDFKNFNDTNVEGTVNVMKFCKKFNKKLYYVSTLSVSGNVMKNGENEEVIEFKENEFYIGQDLNNVYVYTKFEAEKKIFEGIQNGLDACILRIGNVTNRYSDGKFQINVSENAYISRIKSILKLGVIQEKFAKHLLEFTPVDSCAEAITKIVENNPQFTVLHLFNNNFIGISKVIDILKTLNENIAFVSDEEFKQKIDSALKDKQLKNEISGIITDLDENKLLNLINYIIPNCELTQKYLDTIGFSWPNIDEEYITKYLEYFKKIKYI